MENLKAYKKQIEEVQNLVNRLDNGNLAKEDLTKLESLTRMIHERSIILKYLAFGNVEVKDDSKNVDAVENVFLPEETENETSISFDDSIEDKPEIDLFASFEKKEETVEDSIADEVETPLSISDIMDDLQKEEPNFVDEVVEKEITERVVEEVEKEELIEEVVEEMQEMDLIEKVVEEMEEIEITEKVVVAMESIDELPVENKSFLDQLNLNDDSLHSMLSVSKIDTLVGAFSLNEKLRFMNDLFDGSSEDFNETVKILDSQENSDSANKIINSIASKFEWETEDEAVVEFISFINRRYA